MAIRITMAKDPAFLFYSQDFFLGTATMSFEDRGKYITLLSIMHQQGRMSLEDIVSIIGKPSASLSKKFLIDENSLWYNVRLETEIENRRAFIETRRNNGKKGGRPKSEKPLGYPDGKPLAKPNQEPLAPPKENEDEIAINYSYILIREKRVYLDAVHSKASTEEYLLSDTELIENAAKNKSCTENEAKLLMQRFVDANKVGSEFSTDPYGKIRTHFMNWLKFQKVEPVSTKAKLKPSSDGDSW